MKTLAWNRVSWKPVLGAALAFVGTVVGVLAVGSAVILVYTWLI